MDKRSIIYDCINTCSFDSEIGRCKHSERDFASKNVYALKEIIKGLTITLFDRKQINKTGRKDYSYKVNEYIISCQNR